MPAIQLVLQVVLQMVGIWLLTVLVARLIGWQGPAQGALLLSTLFSNSGNIGLPLAYFAFGQEGFAIAGGWFAIMAIGSSTIAPYLAARALVGIRAAIARAVRQPAIYAVVAGLAVNLSGWTLPGPVAKASELLAGGSVAMMLLLVGLQLARASSCAFHRLGGRQVGRATGDSARSRGAAGQYARGSDFRALGARIQRPSSAGFRDRGAIDTRQRGDAYSAASRANERLLGL